MDGAHFLDFFRDNGGFCFHFKLIADYISHDGRDGALVAKTISIVQ